MKHLNYRVGDPILPTESDQKKAQSSSHALAAYLQNQGNQCQLKLMSDDGDGETVEVPAIALELLLEILVHTAEGKPVKIKPYTKELEISQVADVLGVSKHHVWDLLDAGEIPYRVFRNTRRVRFQDAIDYKKRHEAERMKALEELAAQAQELNLGY